MTRGRVVARARRAGRAGALVGGLVFFVATTAIAGPRICISDDTLLFGQREVGSATTATSTVSNCGDAPFAFTDVSVHAATNPAYHVQYACATGATLAPGAACTVSVQFAPTAPGQASGAVWLHNTTATPDQLVTFYGRGVDAQAGTGALVFAPSPARFEATVVGQARGPQVVRVSNTGTAPVVPTAIVINGPAPYDFRGESYGDAGDCLVGTAIAPGGACTLHLVFRPAQAGGREATLLIDAPQLATLASLALQGTGVAVAPLLPVPTVDVIEFHHPPSGQYFLTADTAEAALLEGGGLGPDWRRTGATFQAYPRDAQAPVEARDACRFFGTPGLGPNSHFYTTDAAECAAVGADPHWTREGVAFRAAPPLAAGCPSAYDAVVRLWMPGLDPTGSRHRYTTSFATVASMAQAGWIVEGPVFCVPR